MYPPGARRASSELTRPVPVQRECPRGEGRLTGKARRHYADRMQPRHKRLLRRVAGTAATVLVLLATAGCATPRSEITQSDPTEIVRRLAAPEFDGRLTGTEGNLAAARYLENELRGLGLTSPFGGSMLEWYKQPVLVPESAPEFFAVGAEGTTVAFEPGSDFAVTVRDGLSATGAVEAFLAVPPEETLTHTWAREHRGQALLIGAERFERAAQNEELISVLFAPHDPPTLIVLVLPPEVERLQRGVFLPQGTGDADGTPDSDKQPPFMVQVTSRTAEKLVQMENPRIRLTADYSVRTAEVPNVVAEVAEGPDLPPVIVTAHFDGQGRVGQALFPGAADNAGGVAAALAVAGRLRELWFGQTPASAPASAAASTTSRRPVWIVLFNGEEQGFFGSAAFVREHRSELAGADVINLDMVGHDTTGSLEVTAAPDSESLVGRVTEAITEAGFDTHTHIGGGSDHASFARVAQAVSLIQAPYRMMHTVEDTPEMIDPELLNRIVDMVIEVVADLSQPRNE